MKKILLILVSVMCLATCSRPVAQAPQDPDRQAKIEKALKELKDTNARVRADAIWTLGNLGAKEYTKNIAELLKDQSFLYDPDPMADCSALYTVSDIAEMVLKEWGCDIEKLKSESQSPPKK